MATKSIHKNNNFDKKYIAKKLDQLAEKVSTKNIYVVGKDDYYQVIDYKNNQAVFSTLPTKQIANKICNTLNKNSKPRLKVKELYNLIEYYYKLDNDILYYKNTMRVSTDDVLVFTASTRLYMAKLLLKDTERKILNLC